MHKYRMIVLLYFILYYFMGKGLFLSRDNWQSGVWGKKHVHKQKPLPYMAGAFVKQFI